MMQESELPKSEISEVEKVDEAPVEVVEVVGAKKVNPVVRIWEAKLLAEELRLHDDADPNSLVNRTPKRLSAAIRELPATYVGDSEDRLLKKMRVKGLAPTPTDERLRLSFWREYDAAIEQNRMMSVTRVFGGICGKAYFYHEFMNSEMHMAYLVCRPADYASQLEQLLHKGLSRLQEIMELDVSNPKAANVVLSAIKYLDERVRGATVQRSMNISLTKDASILGVAPITHDYSDVDLKVKELESKLGET